jgi:hypothetical protein
VKLVTKIRNELEGENKYKRVRLYLSLPPPSRSLACSYLGSYVLRPPAPRPYSLSCGKATERAPPPCSQSLLPGTFAVSSYYFILLPGRIGLGRI